MALPTDTDPPKLVAEDKVVVHASDDQASWQNQDHEEPDTKNGLPSDGASDLAAEKTALRKFDWILLPQIMMIGIMAALDRINIGNARMMGFEGRSYAYLYI